MVAAHGFVAAVVGGCVVGVVDFHIYHYSAT